MDNNEMPRSSAGAPGEEVTPMTVTPEWMAAALSTFDEDMLEETRAHYVGTDIGELVNAEVARRAAGGKRRT